MVDEHAHVAQHGLVLERAPGDHVHEAAGHRLLAGRLHQEGRAVGEGAVQGDRLDARVPGRPAVDVDEELPHGRGRGGGVGVEGLLPHVGGSG